MRGVRPPIEDPGVAALSVRTTPVLSVPLFKVLEHSHSAIPDLVCRPHSPTPTRRAVRIIIRERWRSSDDFRGFSYLPSVPRALVVVGFASLGFCAFRLEVDGLFGRRGLEVVGSVVRSSNDKGE